MSPDHEIDLTPSEQPETFRVLLSTGQLVDVTTYNGLSARHRAAALDWATQGMKSADRDAVKVEGCTKIANAR